MAKDQITAAVRGATVTLTAKFLDAAGAVIQPEDARVTFSYLVGSRRNTATFGMALDEGTGLWSYDWDTRAIQDGTVYWSVKSAPDLPAFSADGRFDLTANPANLRP